MPGRISHTEFQSYLRETLGTSAVLKDAGKRGQVDPGDVLVYRKDGRLVRTTLGKTRFAQGNMQLSIVRAARAFDKAGVSFASKSGEDRVNKDLWWMGFGGRMGVRAHVKPSDAINDIFKNGEKYSMECATATMVILYKGILDRIGPVDFDREFSRLRIFRWDEPHKSYEAVKREGDLPGFMPGDHTYFKNPDFHPAHSAWQGENVIYLGDGQYFGHGVGIKTEAELLSTLNSLRKDNARVSAFRDDFEVRIDHRRIAKLDLHP